MCLRSIPSFLNGNGGRGVMSIEPGPHLGDLVGLPVGFGDLDLAPHRALRVMRNHDAHAGEGALQKHPSNRPLEVGKGGRELFIPINS